LHLMSRGLGFRANSKSEKDSVLGSEYQNRFSDLDKHAIPFFYSNMKPGLTLSEARSLVQAQWRE